jgi:hypothetical protein
MALGALVCLSARDAWARDSPEPEGPETPSPEPQGVALEAPPAAWLAWQAPAPCPSRDELLGMVTRYIPGAVEDSRGLSCEASIDQTEVGFTARLVVARAGERGKREVTFRDCREAAEFIALSIVLAIDPEAALPSDAGPEERTSGGVTPVPDADVQTPASEPGAAPASEAPAPPGTEPGAAPAREAPAPPASKPGGRVSRPVRVEPKSRAPEPEPRPLSWFGSLDFALLTGILPSGGAGATLGGGRVIQEWEVTLTATVLPGESFTINGAENETSLRWVGGALGVCRALIRRPANFALCGKTVAGALLAAERTAEAPHSGVGGLWGVEIGLQGDVPLNRTWHIRWGGGANLPLVADTFGWADGGVLYRPSPGFAGSVGVGYFF